MKEEKGIGEEGNDCVGCVVEVGRRVREGNSGIVTYLQEIEGRETNVMKSTGVRVKNRELRDSGRSNSYRVDPEILLFHSETE